ncbi:MULTISPECIES: hypothetical protein [unclassified Myroides]|uniref:hypothetical protein n=1 Tax=unclassified Myroides TaxID=2642485 RepID=UPI003D2F81D8
MLKIEKCKGWLNFTISGEVGKRLQLMMNYLQVYSREIERKPDRADLHLKSALFMIWDKTLLLKYFRIRLPKSIYNAKVSYL